MTLSLWRRSLLSNLRSVIHLPLPSQIGSTAGSLQLPAAAVLLQQHHFFRAVPQLVQPPTRPQGLYEDQPATVVSLQCEVMRPATLPGDVFDVPIRRDILQRVVRWQLAKRQQGTHKTKTRAEVSGGGRKPHAQKGTGRARQGTIRAPQYRGGGVVHGPVPRSHAHKLPKKVRQLGLKVALSAKAFEERLVLVDSLRLQDAKTRVLDERLAQLLEGAPRRSVLLVDCGRLADDGGESLRRAANNLPFVDVIPVEGLNVYSILSRDILMMTEASLVGVIERLRRPIKR